MTLQGGHEELRSHALRTTKTRWWSQWPGVGIQTEAARPHSPHGARHTIRNGTVAPDTRGSMARVPRRSSLGPRSSALVPPSSFLRPSVSRSAMVASPRGTKRRARSAMQTSAGPALPQPSRRPRRQPRRGACDAPGAQQRRPGGIGTGGEHPQPALPALPATAPARAAHPAKSTPHRGLGGLVRRSRSSCFRCPAENAVAGGENESPASPQLPAPIPPSQNLPPDLPLQSPFSSEGRGSMQQAYECGADSGVVVGGRQPS